MTDFPRGWSYEVSPAAGVAASITVAGVAGVVHVLDAFYALLQNATGAAANNAGISVALDGVTFQTLGLVGVEAAAMAQGTDSATELGLAANVGSALIVKFNAGVAGMNEFLRIQGHDI